MLLLLNPFTELRPLFALASLEKEKPLTPVFVFEFTKLLPLMLPGYEFRLETGDGDGTESWSRSPRDPVRGCELRLGGGGSR